LRRSRQTELGPEAAGIQRRHLAGEDTWEALLVADEAAGTV